MNYPKPPLENAELISLRDAYHIVWGAGSLALRETTTSSSVKAYQGEEISLIFDNIDQIRDEATAILPALPDSELPLIRLGAIVEPLTDKIRDIYAQHNVGPAKSGSALGVHDDRILALQSLDIFIRKSRSELHKSTQSSNNG